MSFNQHQTQSSSLHFRPAACGFCKRNNEPKSVYLSHQLKNNRGQVTCPQLFKYRCELCGATGYEAHTRSYCPTVEGLRSARQHQHQSQQHQYQHQSRRISVTGSSSSPEASSQQEFEQAAASGSQHQSSATGSSSSGSSSSQPEDYNFAIQLGTRMFRNMRHVTNTRFNSAGHLRHGQSRAGPNGNGIGNGHRYPVGGGLSSSSNNNNNHHNWNTYHNHNYHSSSKHNSGPPHIRD